MCSQLPGITRLGKCPVRYDPENLARIFVFVGGRWEEFRSKYADILLRYSVGEAQALARALPAQMAEARRARRNGDSPMARFLLRVHDEQESLRARARTEMNQRANASSSMRSLNGEKSPPSGAKGTRSSGRWDRFRVKRRDAGSSSEAGA